MRPIKIKIGEIEIEAELNQSRTAKLVWEALPFEGTGQMWGEEIYFRIPVDAELESPKKIVEPGDIGYWPAGNAFCIFYGPTPASKGMEIVPASPVDVIGKVKSDLNLLKGIRKPVLVRVEAGM
ncbi:MAG: cyclophilin-like fold protein [bacterium]